MVGAARLSRGLKQFPNPMSAWWLIALIALAIGPPEIVDLVDKVRPDPKNQSWTIPLVPYGFAVTLPFLGLASASLIVQICRLFAFVRTR